MLNPLIVFAVGFCSIFLWGFQSRSVNYGNYGAAGLCSFLIAVSQVSIWHRLATTATPLEIIAYGLSGACAITSSMFVHKRFILKQKG